MARIFLSHASSDKPIVRRIAQALRKAGHDPWLDEEEVVLGDSIPAAVERGLREADFVVVCLSAAAAQRGWVEAERDVTLMQQMRERRPRILPVRLEDVPPPYLLQAIAYTDAFPDEAAFTRAIRGLCRAIEAHSKRAAMPGAASPNLPGQPPVASSPPTIPTATASAKAVPAPMGAVQAPDLPTLEPSSPDTVDVFLSFAPEDAAFARELEKAIAMLKRHKLIRALHSGQISPGHSRDAMIAAQVDAARVVLVLVSNAYLASNDCYEQEMERAIERQKQHKARVIPILVRTTEEWKQSPLGPLVPLPRNGIAVEQWQHADAAWSEIAVELRNVALQILGRPIPPK